jgi:hypothetical protein
LTFRGLRLDLREADLLFSVVLLHSMSSFIGEGSEDRGDTDKDGSDALVGNLGTIGSLRRDSNRGKKLRRFAGSFGDAAGLVVALVGDAGEIADIGRLRVNNSPPKCGLLRGDKSKMAPAVLGRPSFSTVVFSEGRAIRGGVDAPALTMDERLPVAEWPRIVDNDVSVSDEMVERGRMYSTLSEKPTRALEGGRFGDVFGSSGKNPVSRRDGCETDLFTEWPKTNWSPSRGVTGALPARGIVLGSAGRMIAERSCEEMAPERR